MSNSNSPISISLESKISAHFWTEEGFEILIRLVEKYPDTLEQVTIKDEQNKNYSVEQFLDKIKNLKVIKNG